MPGGEDSLPRRQLRRSRASSVAPLEELSIWSEIDLCRGGSSSTPRFSSRFGWVPRTRPGATARRGHGSAFFLCRGFRVPSSGVPCPGLRTPPPFPGPLQPNRRISRGLPGSGQRQGTFRPAGRTNSPYHRFSTCSISLARAEGIRAQGVWKYTVGRRPKDLLQAREIKSILKTYAPNARGKEGRKPGPSPVVGGIPPSLPFSGLIRAYGF
jgi:hypothetical protein